jgi:hypothetical protein
VAAAPNLRLRAHFEVQEDYDLATGISFQQGANTLVSVAMTSAYAALAGGYDLIIPDLSATAEFDTGWGLHPGADVLWNAGRLGGTLGWGAHPTPSDGATRQSASSVGTIAATMLLTSQ